MAFWSISDNKAVTTDGGVNGLPSGVDNDQGSIRYAGNIAETTKFTNVALGEGNPVITITSGVSWIDPANGTLPVSSFNNLGSGVTIRVTQQIAGATNTTLLAGASDSANEANSINQLAVLETKLYKTAVRNGQWNPVDGAFSPAVSVVNSGAWSISANADQSTTLVSNATDNAANPTQAVPGELVYHYGSGAQPTQDEYEARNLW